MSKVFVAFRACVFLNARGTRLLSNSLGTDACRLNGLVTSCVPRSNNAEINGTCATAKLACERANGMASNCKIYESFFAFDRCDFVDRMGLSNTLEKSDRGESSRAVEHATNRSMEPLRWRQSAGDEYWLQAAQDS